MTHAQGGRRPLQFEEIQDWLAQKLLLPKCKPTQVATFWRQMDHTFRFSDYWQTLLLRKMMGHVEDNSTPQYWVRKFRRVLKMDKLSTVKLKELYDRAAHRWGHLVLQTALRGGISELERQGHTPPGGHLVIWELFSPDHSDLLSIARNKCGNPVWPKVKNKFLQLFEAGMKSEIFAHDQIFWQAVKSQVRQAIRMNRARLKDLMEAWRFLFFHVCHPYGGDSSIEFMDEWAENQASLFSGSRWISRGVDD
jgi:hypothetical protein